MKRKSILKEKNKRTENNYQSSESIINIILNKIITLSVRKSYANKLNSEQGNYYFNFIKNNINNMFEPYYIAHTTKESKHKEANRNELFLKVKQPDNNTWVEILEPKYFEIDRFEGSSIKFKELEKNEDETEKSLLKNNKKTKNEYQKSIFSNNKNQNNILKSSKNVKIDFVDKKENYNINTNKTPNKKEDNIKKEKNNIQNENNNVIQNKSKKIQMIDFPNEDIPKTDEEDIDKFNLPEVEILRREIQEQLNKQEEERKKMKQEEEKEKKKVLILNEKKSDKIFDSNKLTFDSNGKIISFRQYKTDNLKDFLIPKNFIKEVKKANTSTTSIKKIQKNNNIISKTPVKTLKLKEENIIKDNRMANKAIKLIENNPPEKIIPSGSNFQLISPNIGVVIMENGQSKEGSREFSKHFKKYSLKDYDEIYNNYLPKINRNFQKTNFENSSRRASLKNNVLNIKNTQSININEESLAYNPLMTSPNKENNFKTVDTPKNNALSSRKINLNNSSNNPLLSSYNMHTSNLNTNNLNTTNLDKYITMKKEGISSLKLELDSLKDLSQNNSIFYKNSLTTRYDDFIGNKFRIKNHSLLNRNTIYKNSFGDFNKKILTNKRWGNDVSTSFSNNNINTVYSKHQTKIQILRELGSNILNDLKVKLPRSRKVNLVIK